MEEGGKVGEGPKEGRGREEGAEGHISWDYLHAGQENGGSEE